MIEFNPPRNRPNARYCLLLDDFPLSYHNCLGVASSYAELKFKENPHNLIHVVDIRTGEMFQIKNEGVNYVPRCS